MKFASINELCEAIFAMEDKYDLLDYDIGGVKLWQYLRMSIYYQVAEKQGIIGTPHPDTKYRHTKQKLMRWLSYLKSAIFHPPFFLSSSADLLVIDHSRSKKYEKKHIDIYSDFLIKRVLNEGRDVCVIERPSKDGHIRKTKRFIKHIDIYFFYHQYLVLTRQVTPRKNEKETIEYLETLIKKELGLDFSLLNTLIYGYVHYKASYRFWRKILLKQQPKILMLLISYNKLGGAIKAAKDLGIEVNELQHGVFSRYHLGYSFPNRTKELDYFPDKFLSWGEYWNELIDLPIPKGSIIDYGFEYFHKMKQRYTDIKKIRGQIVVLSQGAISKALAWKIYSLREELKEYHVIYKLHPSEVNTWKQNATLVKLDQLSHFSVVDDKSDTYKLLAESEYQMGVFSTALFEGAGMGCKTILFSLPGIEYMEKFIQLNYAILYDEQAELEVTFEKTDKIDLNDTTSVLFSTSYNFGKVSALLGLC